MIVHNRTMLDIIRVFDTSNSRVYPEQAERFTKRVEEIIDSKTPYKFLTAIAIPNCQKAIKTTARCQDAISQARLVCALERYQRAQGQYPETFEALAPRFIAKIPPDVLAGVALKYRRTSDGRFVLYSIGWNMKDEGGNPGTSAEENADWIWPYPAPK